MRIIEKISKSKESIIKKPKKLKVEDFNIQLQDILEKNLKEKLDNILEKIDKQMDVLKNNLNFEELNRYKKLVKEFLQCVISTSYYVEEKISVGKKGKQIFNIIRCVNEELENLTILFLKEQKDVLAILSKLDQIRGLLVDIYK